MSPEALTDQQFPVGVVNQHKNSWPPAGKMVVSSREERAVSSRGGEA